MERQMFCYQCEQTAGCSGCTGNAGVCGRRRTQPPSGRADRALIGLARTVDGRETGQETDDLVLEGYLPR